MRISTLNVKVTYAWWFPVYFNSVVLLACALDCEPNMERVAFWMSKATTLTIEDSNE